MASQTLPLHPGTATSASTSAHAGLAARALGVPVVLVWLRRGDDAVLCGAAGASDPPTGSLSVPASELAAGAGWGELRALSTDAAGALPPEAWSELRIDPATSYLSAPLLSRAGEPIGLLLALDRARREWTEEEFATAREAAAATASHVELLVAEESERQRLTTLERQALVFRSIEDGVIITDPEGRILDWNPGAEKMFGYTREEVVGRSAGLVNRPEEGVDTTARILAGIRAQGSWRGEVVFRRKDGSEGVNEVWVVPLRDDSGREIASVGINRDITDRVRTEAELREAERHYRRLVTASPYGIYVLDEAGIVVEANAELAAIVDRPVEDLLGMHFADVIAPEDRARLYGAFQDRLAGIRATRDVDALIVRPSGERREIQIRATPVLAESGVIGSHGVVRDVTEERARDRQIRLLAAALDSMDDAVSLTTADRRFYYVNDAYLRIAGVTREQIGQLRVDDFAAGAEGVREVQEVFGALHETRGWTGRSRRKRFDTGEIFPVFVILRRIDTLPGEEVNFALIRDITHEVEAEEQLRRAERLASMGTLIGGVAHELNNPMSAIMSFAQLLLLDPRSPEDTEALEIIAREADRASRIVSDLRIFARSANELHEPITAVDLNDVVRHVVQVRRYSLDTRNVEVVTELEDPLPAVRGSTRRIEQVVMNLIANAEQAMSAREVRRLTIRTRTAPRGVLLEVEDTGVGIAPAARERIFDPFWTTKEPGEGTGLGLSLAHGIVSEHGGTIEVESEVGRGSRFTVALPVGEGAEKATPAIAEAGMPARSLRVLVVDDELGVRRSAARYLAKRGHRVDEAEDGHAALELLAAGNHYDILLVDLRMPGMGGEALLRELRTRHPPLHERVVFMSGDAVDLQTAESIRAAGVPLLLKPFDLGVMSGVVEAHA